MSTNKPAAPPAVDVATALLLIQSLLRATFPYQNAFMLQIESKLTSALTQLKSERTDTTT
jgi:hypothetical protein